MSRVLNEVGGGAASNPKNLGAKKQRIESPLKTIFLAKETFQFANVAAMKATIDNWKTAVTNKDIIPYPNIEGIEQNNTEANIKEGRYVDYTLKQGVHGVNYRFDFDINTYESVQSHLNTEYTRVFQITESEEVLCDIQSDGSVKGRLLSSFLLTERTDATDDDVPFANVQFKFDNNLFDIVKPGLVLTELEGIVDLKFDIVSASATEIVVEATVEATGDNVSSLQQADFKFLESDGVTEEPITGSSYDADTMRYTLTGTAFTSGGTLQTDGVVTQTNINYEAAPVAVTVS